MKVQVRWFYHPAEVDGSGEGGGRVDDLKIQENALFASSHTDENDVQTISHKCQLLQYHNYVKLRADSSEDLEDVYYLAGDYDPVVGTIKFCPDVIKWKFHVTPFIRDGVNKILSLPAKLHEFF